MMRASGLVLALGVLGFPAFAAAAPTFSKDVAPILYKSCVECHRSGAIAPMALTTFEEVRPWARAVKQKVVARQMPPWGADPAIGKFANDPSLSEAEIATIASWVDSGMAEGSKAEMPKLPVFEEGWAIGKPDLVFKMTEPFPIPADGIVPYTYVTIPTNLKEDIWIKAFEYRTTDRRVLHHIIGDLVEGDGQLHKPSPMADRSRKEIGGFGGYVPGRAGTVFPEGVARKLPAGADLVLQMHYTTIGQPVTDVLEVGVVLAKEPPSRLRQTGGGAMPNATFAIPPGAANHEVIAKTVINRDTYLTSMYPHMHVRGKSAMYKLIYPDGKEEVLLSVPKYDFNWQLTYQLAEPKFIPKGSTLMIVGHYDNSPANRFNPDPTATVRWGEQTWEEMLLGYYNTVEIAPTAAPRQSGAR
jgi:hypothetical protein